MKRLILILGLAELILVGCGSDSGSSEGESATATAQTNQVVARLTGQTQALASKCGLPSQVDARYAIWEMVGPVPLPEPALQRRAKALLTAGGRCEEVRQAAKRFTEPNAAPKPRPEPEPASAGFTGEAKSTYDDAKVACGSAPLPKVAGDLGVAGEADPFAIAEVFAKGYLPTVQQAALEGCYDGLAG